MDRKIRFALIGSGWRAMYYVRIAKALPEIFEMCMMLCTSEEKAQKISETYHIPACADEKHLADSKPDFIVIAAKKDVNADLSLHWMEKGFYVLSETPAACDLQTLYKLYASEDAHTKLVIAEQYSLYPQNIARLKLIERGLFGKADYLYLSLAHEYHAASLMRKFLQLPCDAGFTVTAQEWSFETANTLSRTQHFTDRSTSMKKRTAAQIVFDQGAVCLYDFDSEQYRSPIRSSHFRLQGVYGEFSDDTPVWLDENSLIHTEPLKIKTRTVTSGSGNPNFSSFEEIAAIEWKDEILYAPPFGLCGLSPDETAVAQLLKKMGDYVHGNGEVPCSLFEALADAYTAILMRTAIEEGIAVHSEFSEIR